MHKESIGQNQPVEQPDEANLAERPDDVGESTDPQDVFSDPNKQVIPPVSREEAMQQNHIEPEHIGGNHKPSMSPYWEKGRRARRKSSD